MAIVSYDTYIFTDKIINENWQSNNSLSNFFNK